jgi:hypothetical protein
MTRKARRPQCVSITAAAQISPWFPAGFQSGQAVRSALICSYQVIVSEYNGRAIQFGTVSCLEALHGS